MPLFISVFVMPFVIAAAIEIGGDAARRTEGAGGDGGGVAARGLGLAGLEGVGASL
jgi:hypothetical protein